MIVTVVRFPPISPRVSMEEARELVGPGAASYLDVPGLVLKIYLRSEDGSRLGAVYWWRDRASAEARFNPGWLEGVTRKYGARPEIEWFDVPIAVDNRSGSVWTAPPPGV